MKYIVLAIITVLLFSCSGGEDEPAPKPEPTPIPIPTPTPDTPQKPQNPNCDKQLKFEGGTLWKPKADHTGNLVVLIRKEFVREFMSCSVVRSNGTTEQMTFTGFSNGDRQTWRGSQPGRRYKNTFTCKLHDVTCVWKFKGSSANRHE